MYVFVRDEGRFFGELLTALRADVHPGFDLLFLRTNAHMHFEQFIGEIVTAVGADLDHFSFLSRQLIGSVDIEKE